MNIKETIAASVLAALALSACQGGSRVVENPLIEAANSLTLDITKVELTDTATWLQVDAYRAKDWIRITSDACLHADGRTYALTGAQGITPDSDLWMPVSGETTFRLRFEPLPLRTLSFDFIQENEGQDCFKLLPDGRKRTHAHSHLPLRRDLPDHTPAGMARRHDAGIADRLGEHVGQKQKIYLSD